MKIKPIAIKSKSNGDKIQLNDVVKYFVEQSGMLFFYSPEDVKKAYNRISSILNGRKKHYGINNDLELDKLNRYYGFFIKNYDKYINKEENRNLFVDIMKVDSNIMYCGTKKALELYKKDIKKNLNDANSSLMFFHKRYAVREGMRKIEGIMNRIEEYLSTYNVNIENNEIDKILGLLGLTSLANEDEIVKAYNQLFAEKYKEFSEMKKIEENELKKTSKKFEYLRDVIAHAYGVEKELEQKTLYDIYKQPLVAEPEYYEAFRFFGLDPNCKVEEMIDTVEKAMSNIVSAELIGSIPTYNTAMFKSNKNEMKDVGTARERTVYFKKKLYDYFKVEEEKTDIEEITVQEEENQIEEITQANNEPENSFSYFDILENLDYNEAKKLYYVLMGKMMSSEPEKNEQRIRELEFCWQKIEQKNQQQNKKAKR